MPQLPWLDEQIRFPPVERALREPNGLLAAGGDLSPARLLAAYRAGIFPWYEAPQPILWWAPDPRTVLFPREIHVSRSLRKILRRRAYHVTADLAFEQVVAGCAETTLRRPGTWITDEMATAYTELYDRGIAHSVECWQDGQLLGGLYGVAQGAVFFGESMFSREPDASKVALVYLAGQLQAWGYGLIDCQIGNPHLTRMGAREIPRSEFSALLSKLVDCPMPGGIWQLDWEPEQALKDSEQP